MTAVVGLFVFGRKKSLLHFRRPVIRGKVLVNAASNGCSEMATALVTGIITLMFNWTMLRYVGEDGVAAITIIMYVLMFASSLYTGYSYGVAPMVSFYYGEKNEEKIKKLIAVSFQVIGSISVLTFIIPWGLPGRLCLYSPGRITRSMTLQLQETGSVRSPYYLLVLISLPAGCSRRCQMESFLPCLPFPVLFCLW